MQVSAAICTRNRPDLIAQAVGSVLANDHPSFDLTVVDQSDSDATRRALDGLMAANPHLTYIHTTRVGLSAAYNTAIARSSGEIIAFTDDDCVAPADWLRQVQQAFEQTPDADLLYGQVVCPAKLRSIRGVVPQLYITAPRRISRRDGFMIYGMGANFATRRRLFDAIGGFDEVLGGGGPLRSSQDFDLQYRVYQAGLTTLLAPNVTVDHYGLRSLEDWPKTLVAYGVGDGGFYMKHIRCGDLFATWLLTRKLATQLPRQIVRVARRRHDRGQYLRGLLQGARDSFKFAVDRKQRLYVLPERAWPPAGSAA